MAILRQSFVPRSSQQHKSISSEEFILLPEITKQSTSTSSAKTPRPKWRDGSHFGVVCVAITSGTILSINLTLAVILAVNTNQQNLDGTGTIVEGDCDEIKSLDIWLHLLINILGTLLLGASNYTMQCVSAPTRQDIDDAHHQNTWMDIGIPSTKNVRRIAWLRKIIWCSLLFSSIPLHLLYNSVIFSSTSISAWQGFAVTSDFLAGLAYNTSHTDTNAGLVSFADRLSRLQNSTSLIRLENEACVAAYNPTIVSSWGDLLVVGADKSTNNSFLNVVVDSSGYLTGQSQSALSLLSTSETIDPENWIVPCFYCEPRPAVSHCMATTIPQHCKLHFSMPLIIAILICNSIKVICMTVMIWKMDSRPLATLGDAIASFLDCPDPTTTGNCLGGKARFEKASTWDTLPVQYQAQKHRGFASASCRRCYITTVACALTLVIAMGLLCIGITKSSAKSPLTLGFGAINTSTILNIGISGLIMNILLANSPQVLLSILYFAYNCLWTYMLLSKEWSSYAKARKPLRVTSPTGQQRSTYRLQLPYRYSILLLTTSAVLHWLVSQSIFLVVLDAYHGDGSVDIYAHDSLTTCGYSPSALLTTILTGMIALASLVVFGCRRTGLNGIPLASSCSAAISAACHPPLGDGGASTKAVMWGACGSNVDGDWGSSAKGAPNPVGVDESLEDVRQKVGKGAAMGHCSFTSFAVEEPVEGKLYAGR